MLTTPNFSTHHDPVRKYLAELLASSLAGLSASDIFHQLEKPPELKLGDYAFPCFSLAKSLRKNPAQIAQELKKNLEEKQDPWLERIEVVGAFLNLFTNKQAVAELLLPAVLEDDYFRALRDPAHHNTRVMIEFSQPNTHKEFHVGHVRNVALGDAIARIFVYNGYQVIPVNYIGDEGTHVAKCLWQVQQHKGEASDLRNGEWYGKRYVEANKKLEDASEADKVKYQKEISDILAALEAKKGPTYDLWLQSKQECMQDFEKIYRWLDVHFDHIFYESDVSEEAQNIVSTYLKKGVFVESEGAIGIPMDDVGLGFMMVRKTDGTTLYITKDIALAIKKFQDFKIDRSIYVVGAEQNFHFRQLFRCFDLIGFKQAKDCHHLSYALVMLPEGKMSSRKGNVFTFSQFSQILLKELDAPLQKYKGDWSEQEITETAHKLAVGAIKYGMLSSDPQKEIVFDPKAWTSFEGNSGPYLMYSYARTCSILRKCEESSFHPSFHHLVELNHPLEHELLRLVYDFNEVCKQACDHYKPSAIANHLFTLCKAFNRFYAERSVLNADRAEERSARLALVKAFSRVLHQGLALLGITPPEKM